MPTQIYVVTDTPADLLAANDVDGQPLSLEVGKRYSGRYTAVGPQSILKFLAVASGTTVTADSPATPLQVFEDIIIVPLQGEEIYVWGENDGQIAINDIA